MNSFLTSLDWTVFVFFQVLTIAAVWYGHTRILKDSRNTVLDYLLMGRELTLPLFIATLVASWYGGIFGVTQISFEQGIYNFLTQGVFWYAAYLIFAFVLVHRIRAYDSVTLPDLLGKMFGPRSARVGAVFNFINVLPIAYCISMGILLQAMFGGSLSLWILLGTLFVAGYSVYGGFRAIVFSDAVQCAVMCAGVFIVVALSYLTYGGWGYLRAHLPPGHFAPMGGESWFSVLAWGFIAMATLVDPSFYQRTLAAKNEKIARNGILISTLIWFGFDVCTTLGGMYARAALPNANPKEGYLLYSMQLLPSGVRGLFLAGAFATIISTLDAFLNIAGQTISYDLLPQRFRSRKIAHVLSFLFVALLSVAISRIFQGSIKLAWKTMGSYAAGCLLFPMLYAFFRPGRISDRGFVLCSLMGAVAITAWTLIPRTGVWVGIDALYPGVAVTAFISIMVRTNSIMKGN